MIRKAVIVILTLGAAASFLTGLASLAKPVAVTAYSDKDNAEYLGFRVEDGFLMLVWSRTSSETCLSPVSRGGLWSPLASFWVAGFGYMVEPGDGPFEVTNVSEEAYKFQHWAAEPLGLMPRGGTHTVYQLGANSALLFALFAAYPTLAFIRGPLRRWRRRKRGECLNCGYNLTGNVTGVCSECGTKIESP